jgi:hypothetical protein
VKAWSIVLVKTLWWLMVARLPISINQLSASYAKQIGCPASGDCYVPGSELLLSFDVLAMGSAVLLWPVCVWFLGGGWIVRRVMRATRSSLPQPSTETPPDEAAPRQVL